MGMPTQQGSYIDLKNCTIYIEDGYSKTGAVNNMAGYSIGATSFAVDGLPALTVIPVGVRITFTGDTNIYYVASTTESAGLTVTVTLDRALVVALTDDQVVTFGPHALEIKVGDGTFSYSETKNREYKLNRGIIDKVRNGDQAPLEVTTVFAWTHITAHSSETIPTIEDALKKRGPAVDWVSTGTDCDPYSVDLIIMNSPAACTGETYPVERIFFSEFRYEKLDHDAKAGTINVNGKCNATEPTVTRSAT